MPITGSCRCNAVTYQLRVDALPDSYVCHCLDCQTWSGSAFAEHALLPEKLIALEGETTTYARDSNGFVSEQIICKICHTRIYNRNSAVPGMIVLRAGTLTASDRLAPMAHIWVKRKQDWVVIPAGIPAWPESPTPTEFGEALRHARGKR